MGRSPIAERVLEGHVPSGARVIRWLEDDDARGSDALRRLHPRAGRAHIVGLTGPPGAGKSTLAGALVAAWRRRGDRVGVLAVDPSSPFSGGAILGDRLRMQEHATDRGVFIRSMATRGALGGLCRAAGDATTVLDAMGFEIVLIETVGVGQDELDVAALAHTTAVVCLPGTGDEVQALKAGILEAADCLVLNKADLVGADAAERHLRAMLHLEPEATGFARPLLRTVAEKHEGIDALVDAIDAHRAWLRQSGELERIEAARARHALIERMKRLASEETSRAIDGDAAAAELVADVIARRIDPHSAAQALWSRLRERS